MKRGLLGVLSQGVCVGRIEEARIAVGVLGASLTVSFSAALISQWLARRTPDNLWPSKDSGAEAVYRVCQAQDQAWREKRRVRELEEMRARSGGIQLGTSGAATGLASSPTGGGADAMT
jgi:hypothetical protein